MIRKLLLPAAFAGLFLLATGSTASAANALTNPGFESGLSGWTPFGNVYAQTTLPPQFVVPGSYDFLASYSLVVGEFDDAALLELFGASGAGLFAALQYWSGQQQAPRLDGPFLYYLPLLLVAILLAAAGLGRLLIRHRIEEAPSQPAVGGANIEAKPRQ